MRCLVPLLTLLAATPASAHIGHLGTVAGHDHVALAAGVIVITGAAVVAWLKGGKAEKDEAPEEAEEAEPAVEDSPA